MMKLSAIFSVLFLASASQGFDMSSDSLISSITEIKNKVDSTVESAIANVQAAAEKGVSDLTTLADNVSATAVSTVGSLQADIEDIVVKAESEAESVLSQVSATTAKSCSSLTDTLSATSVDIVSEATSCATKKVQSAYGHITDLKTKVKTLISKLHHVSSATAECVSDVTSLSNTVNAFLCVNKQLATATVLSASSAITVTEKVAKLASLIGDIQTQVPLCVVMDTVAVLANQATNVVKDVRHCVKNLVS